MGFQKTAASTLPFLLPVLLAACADELTHQQGLDGEGFSARERDEEDRRGAQRAKMRDAFAPCIAADAGAAADADPLDAGSTADPDAAGETLPFDSGRQPVPSTGSGALYPSSAVGAHPGDYCSPVSGEGRYWAMCESRRGLRCLPPQHAEGDAPSTCACPPGAKFEGGACVGADWDGPDANDATKEPLRPSTAQGQKYGSQCTPGPFPEVPWAECDARRGLQCRLPSLPPGLQDLVKGCFCPVGSTFVEGICVEKSTKAP